LGPFYTVGFQEDFMARLHGVFDDEEFAEQSEMVLQQRLEMLDYAMQQYEDGVLFYYFSSTDLQSHMFWWDSERQHPCRSRSQAARYHEHVRDVYRRMDEVLAGVLRRYGDDATVLVLSDHGFARLHGLFGLNSWLAENGYLKAPYGANELDDVDWSATRAYGVGLNGLYLNLKSRESHGVVERGEEREKLLAELAARLREVRDGSGNRVIRNVYRSDEVYRGAAEELAPDLIIGYERGYRCSFTSGQGGLAGPVLESNTWSWAADHCFDPGLIPGVLCCNREITARSPALTDLAPTILAQYELERPDTMTGHNILAM
jgi:predicted AlkP superfamily phosphohydrolase/phosphomutase